MNKIKNYIIHKLGGYTLREYNDNGVSSFRDGKLTSLYSVKQYAGIINGLDADHWCKDMYTFVEESIKCIEEMY